MVGNDDKDGVCSTNKEQTLGSWTWKVNVADGPSGQNGENLRFGQGPRQFDVGERVGLDRLTQRDTALRSAGVISGGAVGARDRLRDRVEDAQDLVTLFMEFRYRGVAPHPWGEEHDLAVAAMLFSTLSDDDGALAVGEGGEASVEPHPPVRRAAIGSGRRQVAS